MTTPVIPAVPASPSQLPSIPLPTPQNVQQVLQLVQQVLNALSGASGNGSAKAATVQQLIASGIATASSTGALAAVPNAGITPLEFAQNLQAVTIVGTLPTLPSVEYPVGSYVVLSTNGKLYRNVAGAWSSAVDGADLIAQSVAATAILDGTLTGTQIANAAIAAAQLANSSVTAPALALGAVTAAALAANAVEYVALAAGAVDATKFAVGQAPVAVGSALPNPAGYTGPLTFFDTTDGKLYRYVSGAWTKAVDGADLIAASITAGAIAAGAITATALAAGSVTTTALAAGSVTASVVAAGAIGTTELAAASVTATKMAADSVVAAAITAGAITTAALAAGSVTANAIAAGAITATALAANSVTTAALAAGSVTASALAANSVTAGAIAAGAVTAASLNVATLSAITANMGILTAGLINDVAGHVSFDLSVPSLTIKDAQSTPATRVVIGNLGSDYGIDVYRADGTLLFGASQGAVYANGAAVNGALPPVVNPNFADGLNGWTEETTGWSQGSQSGFAPNIAAPTYAQKIGSAGNGGIGASSTLTDQGNMPVVSGQVVSVTAWINPTSSPDGYAYAGVGWYDNTGALISVTEGAAVSSALAFSKATGPAPSNAAVAKLVLGVAGHTVGFYNFNGCSTTYQPSTLDEIPNGAHAFAVINAGGMNAVSSVDTNNRALIDFTQGGHLSKILDNIGDGTTYLRMPGSNMDVNRRGLIDFTQGGHLGKILDNVGDGTTYLRMPGSNMDVNRRGLIDFTQSGHLNKTLDEIPNGAHAFAVINAGGMNAVSSVDTNNRALIDFTQSGHLSKILDNIGDGSTYARPLATALTSGSVDLSKAGVIGKTLANVADTATRFAAVQAGADHTASNTSALTASLSNQTLDALGDGSTYARPLATALTLGQVDLSAAGVIGKTLANVADTATRFAAVQAGADHTASNTAAAIAGQGALATQSNVDLAGTQILNKILDNIGDGTTYYRMPGANMDVNRRALIDFTQSGHLNKTLDYIANTATAVKSSQSAAVGSQLAIENNTFQLPVDSQGVIPGWTKYTSGDSIAYHSASPSPALGSQYLFIFASVNGGGAIANVRYYPNPGDTVTLAATFNAVSAVSSSILIAFFNAAGTNLGIVSVTSASNTWQSLSSSGVVPAGTASAQILATTSAGAGVLLNSLTITINDVRVAGSGAYAFVDFTNNASPGHVGKQLDNIGDGSTYARILGTQLTSGQHKLEIAGSAHQVGDQLNLHPILTAGAQAVWENLSITYTSAAGTPATATISVSAAQVLGLKNAGALVSYNASSANVTGTGGTTPTYFLYYIDPTGAGGTQTLYATTTSNTMRQQLGIVYIGSVAVAFPTSGTGGGSGGGGLCVADTMFVRRGRTAAGAVPDDEFDCVDFPTGRYKHTRRLLSVTRGEEHCVRMLTDAGAALVCSISTPFDLPDGRARLAPDMLGEYVLTDHGIERVVSVTDAGRQPVSRIHLGGVSYAAGEDAAHRIYSHNGISKQ